MNTKRMKILVAYDGSAYADAALEDLGRAGLPDEAEALVLSVAEVWFLPAPPPSSYEVVESALGGRAPSWGARHGLTPSDWEALGLATAAAERLRRQFPSWEVRAEDAAGSPAKEILERADAWEPDLIVLGSRGRSALGRVLLGSVSQKVVTEARTSVRVARGAAAPGREAARVVIGLDGSRASLAAVRAVAARVWSPQSEVLVVAAENSPAQSAFASLTPRLTAWISESHRSEDEWVRKMLEGAVADLRAAGLNVSTSVVQGDPKRVLVEEAERWEADSIFVGSVGFSGSLDRFLLGSVSAAVAARAHCSVEVVRPT